MHSNEIVFDCAGYHTVSITTYHLQNTSMSTDGLSGFSGFPNNIFHLVEKTFYHLIMIAIPYQ